MQNTLSVRFLHAYKSESEWSSLNPVAKKGEMMISSDKIGMFKVGNGTSKWSELPYNNANNANSAGSISWSNISGKPSTYTPSSHTHSLLRIDKVTKTSVGSAMTSYEYNGGSAVAIELAGADHTHPWSEIYGKPSTFTPSAHTHSNFIIKLNGGTTEGTNLFTYNGGNAKTINITPSSIGAAPSSHTHSQYYDANASRTANTVLAAPNGSNGGATFRKLVAADIPSLSYLSTSGGTLSGDLKVNKSIITYGLEIYHASTPFIDFHYNNDSSVDYTSRIIELEKGKLNINGTVCSDGGSLWCKSFSVDGGGTFGGDLSANRGLYLKHGGTSLYLYNENGGFVMMHTGTDGNSTWPVIWSFASNDLYFGNNIRCGGSGTFSKGVNATTESTFCNGSYTDPLPGISCGIKVSGIATATRFYVKGRSTSWLNGAQPGGAGFECVNDGADNALIPGWRIRNYSGAWVGSSYNLDKCFHLYYAKAERLSGNTSNGTDADFIFNASSGNFSAKSVTQTSDERKKFIISSSILNTYKDFFMKIKPFSFKWKDGQDDTATHLGVGAQSIYQTALDCGFTDDDLGFIHKGKEYPGTSIPWSISYTEFIPLNIAMTQDHESRIEKLERENEELKQQIKELKGLTA